MVNFYQATDRAKYNNPEFILSLLSLDDKTFRSLATRENLKKVFTQALIELAEKGKISMPILDADGCVIAKPALLHIPNNIIISNVS